MSEVPLYSGALVLCIKPISWLPAPQTPMAYQSHLGFLSPRTKCPYLSAPRLTCWFSPSALTFCTYHSHLGFLPPRLFPSSSESTTFSTSLMSGFRVQCLRVVH